MNHTHVIPVDDSLDLREAWVEICIFGRRLTFTGGESWGTVQCDGEECSQIEEAPWAL